MSTKRRIVYCIFILILMGSIINFSTLSYVTTFVVDQVSLVSRSEPISQVLKDPTVSEGIRVQLELVPELILFGDNYKFPETKAYAKYIPLDRQVFLYSLSAAKKDSFEEYYWFKFVGGLPYKGFVRKQDAVVEENELKVKGYDTSLSEASAMSTLGILPDPIITTMINETDVTELIYMINHERTHQLFYRQEDVPFNENSAVLLSFLITREFVKQKYGEKSMEFERVEDMIHDTRIFSIYITQLYQELDTLYSSDVSSAEKMRLREEVFTKYKEKFETTKKDLRRYFKNFNGKKLNNAKILSDYRYYGKFDVYYQVYEQLGNDTAKTVLFFNETAYGEEQPDIRIKDFLD